jgi:glycosyltransferase involved in cell wall biosynthesis
MVSYFAEHFGPDFCYELVLVNDGSRDNTGVIIGQLEQKYPMVKAVSYEQNGGK